MTKRIITLVTVIALIVCLFSFSEPASAAQKQSTNDKKQSAVASARFLNMLNHNFVYDEDFYCVDDIVNDSVIALLDKRADEDFINADFVCDYVKDMYGIEVEDLSGLNAEYPQKDGYVFIIPRGFATYRHELLNSRTNEDGSITVVTDVTISQDGITEKARATTLFVKNEESDFGYNIVYSNIITDPSDI